MTYNRTEPAQALLAEIEAWCAATATPETSVGRVLFLHPGFVGLLRRRLTVSEEKEQAVRGFMVEHKNGWRGELPLTHGNGTRPIRRSHGLSAKFRLERGSPPIRNLSDQEIDARRTDRDPCPRCGVRGDISCGHSHAPLRVL